MASATGAGQLLLLASTLALLERTGSTASAPFPPTVFIIPPPSPSPPPPNTVPSPSLPPSSPPLPPAVPLACSWVQSATASTQYATSGAATSVCTAGSSNLACEVIGVPDVAPSCADQYGAWAPSTSGADAEWLEVTYASFFIVYRVLIYETNQAPFVTKVEANQAAGGASTTIWEGTDTTACGSALTIAIDGGVVSNQLRIHTARSGYEQVDAVQLCGMIVAAPPSAPPLPPLPPTAPPPCTAQVDLVLVIDNSRSVAGERATILDFALAVVSKFEVGAAAAQIAYVEFAGSSTIISDLTSSLSNITSAINNARGTGRGTYLSDGVETGQAAVTGTNARVGVPKVRLRLACA